MFWLDLRFSGKLFVFTRAAVITLALGIVVTAMALSSTDSVRLHPSAGVNDTRDLELPKTGTFGGEHVVALRASLE